MFEKLICAFTGHIQGEISGDPYPYPHGIDNPFTSENIGWGRAWRIPMTCKRCGGEYTEHRSAPSLLQRHTSFYWSATEPNISLVSQISKKLNALNPNQLKTILSHLNQIHLSCEVCDFITTDPDEYRNHIIDKHMDVLQLDVINTYIRRTHPV